jgi:hypothetical protein
MAFTEADKARGAKVLLHTALRREDLFTWQEEMARTYAPLKAWLVDTWTIEDHPAPDGSPFTLYACTIVLTETQLISAEEAKNQSLQALWGQARRIRKGFIDLLDGLPDQR